MDTKSPISILQEFMTKKYRIVPHYDIIHDETGSHIPMFHYKVTAGPTEAVGIGRSKREAKHEAARKALDKLAELFSGSTLGEHSQSNQHSRSPSPCLIRVNHVGALTEYCAEKSFDSPEWIFVSDVGPPHARQFTCQCIVGYVQVSCTNNSKKLAKQDSAKKMLQQLMGTSDDSVSGEVAPLGDFEKYNAAACSMFSEIENSNPNKMRVKPFITDFDKRVREKARETLEAEHGSMLIRVIRTGKILNFQVEINSLPSGTNNIKKIIKLTTNPELTFIGLGANEKLAVYSGLEEAIKSLRILLSE